ncbi:hypothetical protein ACFQY0_17290 [Haloferula chungangensis]|uniref:DUF3109 family protein n=1 Tax=Haloferula chungangensis TaxID=1048331 RepID=A0ABW2LCQ3_9BACT
MRMESITAYPELEGELARQIREAAVDYDSFSQNLKLCDLGSCRATCCHDGVFLTGEEQRVIGEVIEEGRERLDQYGWTEKAWLGDEGGRAKSITLGNKNPGARFPSHFPRTRCVFLDAGHRCVLQRLAMDAGRHPWFWKPISCWMHPLVLKPGERGGRPILTLPSPGNDPAAKPGYPGFSACTPCGMEASDGKPAWQVLGDELELLGEIGGRGLLGEITSAVESPAHSAKSEE